MTTAQNLTVNKSNIPQTHFTQYNYDPSAFVIIISHFFPSFNIITARLRRRFESLELNNLRWDYLVPRTTEKRLK